MFMLVIMTIICGNVGFAGRAEGYSQV